MFIDNIPDIDSPHDMAKLATCLSMYDLAYQLALLKKLINDGNASDIQSESTNVVVAMMHLKNSLSENIHSYNNICEYTTDVHIAFHIMTEALTYVKMADAM